MSIQTILSKHLFSGKCLKLLCKDGITNRDFVIEKLDGVYELLFVENFAREKSSMPSLGHMASILKNLDHYQNLICHDVISLADILPIKRQLQKYRVCIIVAFHDAVNILKTQRTEEKISQWNSNATILLNEVSDVFVKFRLGQTGIIRLHNSKIDLALEYFQINPNSLEKLIDSFYEQVSDF